MKQAISRTRERVYGVALLAALSLVLAHCSAASCRKGADPEAECKAPCPPREGCPVDSSSSTAPVVEHTGEFKPRPIIAISMLGMDLFTHKEYTGHPFDISQFKHLPMDFDSKVTCEEHYHAAPIYEMAKVVDGLRKGYGLRPDQVQILFTRGTFGEHVPKWVRTKLEEHSERLGKDAFKVIVAKSFGGTDAIRALAEISDSAESREKIGEIDLLVLVDPTGPNMIEKEVLTFFDVDGKQQGRFPVPTFVKLTYDIVQRVDDPPFRGYFAGFPGQPNITNLSLTPDIIDHKYKYCGYCDCHVSDLTVSHSNMDELVVVGPLFERNLQFLTLPQLIRREYAAGLTEH